MKMIMRLQYDSVKLMTLEEQKEAYGEAIRMVALERPKHSRQVVYLAAMLVADKMAAEMAVEDA